MSPDLRRDPPYIQVFRHYQDLIIRGELRDGDPVPSVRMMTGEWGISHATAARVFSALQAEGLIESRPGIGSVVTTRGIMHSSRDRAVSVRRTGQMSGPGESARIVSAELIRADERLARALRLRVGDTVIARRRITLKEGKPVQRSISYLPGGYAEQAPGLLETERLPGGTMGYLEGLQKYVTHGTDQYAVLQHGATAEEAADLQVPEGSPVQAGRNWWRGADGEVIEYGESTTVPGRWQTFDWIMPDGPDEHGHSEVAGQ
ncbi:MAG: GntR family transcriptional regulator [bacterium]